MHNNLSVDLIADYIRNLTKSTDPGNLDIFRAFADTSPLPFCIIDFSNNSFLISNRAHEELLRRIFDSHNLKDLHLIPDSDVPFAEYRRNIEMIKVPFVEEHEYKTTDGETLTYELHGYPVISKEENYHYVILHYRDKTNEVIIREEMQEYRNTLKDLFYNLPGMVFRCLNETNWTVEFASPGSKALTGYTPEELINNNKIRYGDLIHPDDRQMVWDTIQDAIKRKRHYDVKYRIITKKGQVKWVAERGNANFDKYERVVSIEGFISDISEGKTAELNLQKELLISEAIARISMELLKDTVTPIEVSRLIQEYVKEFTASELTFIYTPDENGSTHTLFSHWPEDKIITIHSETYSREEFQSFRNLIDSKTPVFINEPADIKMPGYDGSEINQRRLLSIPAYINNKLTGLLIIIRPDKSYTEEDIAVGQRFINMFALGIYRLKAEETLQEAKAKAEESDRLKSLFLSNMSHEIRTPMNAIVGFAEMLQDSDLDRDQKNKFLDVIIKSGDNLLRLINDIIDISKIEAGQLKFDYSDCLVNEMISDLETYFKQEMVRQRKSHINLFVQLGHPESDFALYTDCFRLKQILNNLIGNAVKFTDEGFIEYGYQIKSGVIEFFVRDSGIGIAPDKQNVIFERFGQVREAISRNQTGTGLGLTISKNLVELLGGEIWVDSLPGEGSTFYFTLPLRVSAKTVNKSNEEQAIQPKPALDLTGKTILVVEDVDTNYFYMSSLLQKFNCTIIRANNGAKAVELCRTDSSINLVLMDIELPVMDGYKATIEIKKIRPDLPIIAQTAFAMMGERERSKEAGCNDYLAKPIRKEELVSTLRKYI